MVWLGLDPGAKRTGVAISRSGRIATPWGVVTGSRADQITQLVSFIQQEAVDTIVVGTSRDTPSPTETALLTELSAALKTAGWHGDIHTVNESLTSKEAERLMRNTPSSRRQPTDAIAAQLILEEYLAQ